MMVHKTLSNSFLIFKTVLLYFYLICYCLTVTVQDNPVDKYHVLGNQKPHIMIAPLFSTKMTRPLVSINVMRSTFTNYALI